jgi:hypothetical protein
VKLVYPRMSFRSVDIVLGWRINRVEIESMGNTYQKRQTKHQLLFPSASKKILITLLYSMISKSKHTHPYHSQS